MKQVKFFLVALMAVVMGMKSGFSYPASQI